MKIKCVDTKQYISLTKGKKYEMLWEDEKKVEIINDSGKKYKYPKYLFIPLICQEKYDNIHKPKHYNLGIETIDYINSWNMGYMEGNIIKYITRYKYKNGLEDLKKAQDYIEKLIKVVEKNGI